MHLSNHFLLIHLPLLLTTHHAVSALSPRQDDNDNDNVKTTIVRTVTMTSSEYSSPPFSSSPPINIQPTPPTTEFTDLTKQSTDSTGSTNPNTNDARLAQDFISQPLFQSTVLNSTNHYRTQHNASSLTYNATLARFASNFLSSSSHGNSGPEQCTFEHSGGPFGENLAIGCSDVAGCVEIWGDERDEYDFDDGKFDKKTGHFTQLVWKDTTDVGCARKWCGDGGGDEDGDGDRGSSSALARWYLVCEYWPRGNVLDQFEDMVQSQVGGTSDAEGGMGALGWRAWLVGVIAWMGWFWAMC